MRKNVTNVPINKNIFSLEFPNPTQQKPEVNYFPTIDDLELNETERVEYLDQKQYVEKNGEPTTGILFKNFISKLGIKINSNLNNLDNLQIVIIGQDINNDVIIENIVLKNDLEDYETGNFFKKITEIKLELVNPEQEVEGQTDFDIKFSNEAYAAYTTLETDSRTSVNFSYSSQLKTESETLGAEITPKISLENLWENSYKISFDDFYYNENILKDGEIDIINPLLLENTRSLFVSFVVNVFVKDDNITDVGNVKIITIQSGLSQ